VRPRTYTALTLGAALAAAGALLVVPLDRQPSRPQRVSVEAAWPGVQRADIPARLADATAYDPLTFLDARTSIGTAETPDGTALRLVLRDARGSVRELRRHPVQDNPLYQSLTTAGDEVAWAEATSDGRYRLWALDPRGNAPARQVTADTGNALLYNWQHDLVFADGRLHWTAADPDDPQITQIRSVPLTGGTVAARTQPGSWALSTWPWLVDVGANPLENTRLHDLGTGREITVPTTGVQTTRCTPTWCRAEVATGGGTVRIDLMRPDGSARRRVAGGTASPALIDVAPLDSFEILVEPHANSELTGTTGLAAYDITTGRTVDISPDAANVAYRNGVLWWSSGIRDTIIWHTLDLRTV
jgi:hypothetical protein